MKDKEWIYVDKYRRYIRGGITQLYKEGQWITIDTHMSNGGKGIIKD